MMRNDDRIIIPERRRLYLLALHSQRGFRLGLDQLPSLLELFSMAYSTFGSNQKPPPRSYLAVSLNKHMAILKGAITASQKDALLFLEMGISQELHRVSEVLKV